MKYFIVENGRSVGPFEPYELMSRGLTSRSYVWNKTMSRWTQAGRVPELQQLLSGGVTFDNGPAYGGYLAQANYGPAAQRPVRRRSYRPSRRYYVVAPRRRSNGLGIAGFVLAMVSVVIFLSIAVDSLSSYAEDVAAMICLVTSVLAFIFSMIGVFRRPRGLAIAGLAVSAVFLVIYLLGFLGALSYPWYY